GHPAADRRHRDLFTRHHAAFDKEPADRDIGLAVAAVIADPHGAAFLQPYPARALDFEKERVHRIVDPEDLVPCARQRAVFDLGAGVAPRIRWAAVYRHPKGAAVMPRPMQCDLEIAGEEPVARAV